MMDQIDPRLATLVVEATRDEQKARQKYDDDVGWVVVLALASVYRRVVVYLITAYQYVDYRGTCWTITLVATLGTNRGPRDLC